MPQNYVFDGSSGQRSLLDLFGSCSQLLVYHFMFGPEWKEGCKICSMYADHYDPLVTVSRAPIETLAAFHLHRPRGRWRRGTGRHGLESHAT